MEQILFTNVSVIWHASGYFFGFHCHLLLSICFLERYRVRRQSKQLYIQTKYRSERNNDQMLCNIHSLLQNRRL